MVQWLWGSNRRRQALSGEEEGKEEGKEEEGMRRRKKRESEKCITHISICMGLECAVPTYPGTRKTHRVVNKREGWQERQESAWRVELESLDLSLCVLGESLKFSGFCFLLTQEGRLSMNGVNDAYLGKCNDTDLTIT